MSDDLCCIPETNTVCMSAILQLKKKKIEKQTKPVYYLVSLNRHVAGPFVSVIDDVFSSSCLLSAVCSAFFVSLC